MLLLSLVIFLVIPWVQSVIQDQPAQQGELVLAVHCGLWKIYQGGWLNHSDGDSYISKVTGIKYYSDDPYCIPEDENYDCICHDDCCGAKRCYTYQVDQNNTDDDELFSCSRIANHLHWRFPASVIGAPGVYHFSILTSDDKWHEFATSNNGRKYEVWIDKVSQGVFDMYGWSGARRWMVNEEFTFTLAAGAPYVDLEMTRFTTDRQNPNAPDIRAIQIRKGPASMSPKYSRQDQYKTWSTQNYDGSNWIYVIDVAGGGSTQQAGLVWSQDWGYFFPPNLIGSGRMSWHASLPINNSAPFPDEMWTTLRKSVTAEDQYFVPLTYKLPVPSDGVYWVVLFLCDDDYARPFQVEFGRCNDQAGTGAVYDINMGNKDRQAFIFAFKVPSRDRMLTLHMGLQTAASVPVLAGLMVKADDGKTPSFVSGEGRFVVAQKPYTQSACTSNLKGAYPDYDLSTAPQSPTSILPVLPPTPSVEPAGQAPFPVEHGQLKLALHTSLYKIYSGGILQPDGSWTGSAHNITYKTDDPYCVSIAGYDCPCKDSTCLNKRCYQMCRPQKNTDDDYLYECSRIGEHLKWTIPVSDIGPVGDYHVVLLSTEDKWHEFAKSNNGRKFEVWINGVWQGDFDFYGWTGGVDYVVAPEFPIRITAGMTQVDIEMIRYVLDGGNPNQPLVQAIQIRTGLPNMSPLYSRPPRLQAWFPQTFDGSTFIWAIDVAGGGFFDAPNNFWWSMDFGYFFPPNKAGTGTMSWRAGVNTTYSPPFPIDIWTTVRKSPTAEVANRIFNMTYKIPVPTTNAKYIVSMLYIDDDYPQPFDLEFGRCNDQAGTGAIYHANIGRDPGMPWIYTYTVPQRDGLITVHFGLTDRMKWMPALTGILIKAVDGKTNSFMTGANRVIEPEKPFTQPSCTSTLKGAYPEYDLSAVADIAWTPPSGAPIPVPVPVPQTPPVPITVPPPVPLAPSAPFTPPVPRPVTPSPPSTVPVSNPVPGTSPVPGSAPTPGSAVPGASPVPGSAPTPGSVPVPGTTPTPDSVPVPVEPPSNSSGSSGGFPGWAIAVIVIGVLAMAALAGLLYWFAVSSNDFEAV